MRRRKEKGITLIALIITIIIMLILVTLTVTSAVNGGIFKKAGEAVSKTRDSMKNEQDAVNQLLAEIEKYQSGENPNTPIESEPPTVEASAEKSYDNGNHKITITATGTAAEEGTLNYNVKLYKGEYEEEKTETQKGTSGEQVTFIFENLEKYTSYTYEIEVEDENEQTGSCDGTCTTYCVGEHCDGTTLEDCNTCGGTRRSYMSGWFIARCVWCFLSVILPLLSVKNAG